MNKEHAGMSVDHRRDLELLLLGAALASAERDRILTMLPAGSLARDVDPLLNALRPNSDPEPLRAWLDTRGVVREKGKQTLDCIVDVIESDNHRAQLKAISRELRSAEQIGDIRILREKLTKYLEMLEVQ